MAPWVMLALRLTGARRAGAPLTAIALVVAGCGVADEPPRPALLVANASAPASAHPAGPVLGSTPAGRSRAVASRAVAPRGDGIVSVVPGRGPDPGGRPRHYLVEVEGGLRLDGRAFAAAVERTLGDRRSWGAAGRRSFQRVDSGPVALRVALVSPRTTDRLCAPLPTGGIYSCASRQRAVINTLRWEGGSPAYRGNLAGYRVYVVNHEVGHVLGNGHRSCPGTGRPAPVMMQQTKGVGACRANPWPFP